MTNNLYPPPEATHPWLRDVYDFIKNPVWETIRLNPQQDEQDEEDGRIYFDDPDSSLNVYSIPTGEFRSYMSMTGGFEMRTGYNNYKVIPFNNGTNEPTLGSVMYEYAGGTPADATGVLHHFTKTGGEWSTNNAQGRFYLTNVTGTWNFPGHSIREGTTYVADINGAPVNQSYDFDAPDFTQQNDWYDLDLQAFLPTPVPRAVLIFYDFVHDSADYSFFMRTNNERFSRCAVTSQVSQSGGIVPHHTGEFILPLNDTAMTQFFVTTGTPPDNVRLFIKGWWV
jgi:hypothetical protein